MVNGLSRFGIASRMVLMPIPRGFHNRLQRLITRRPPQNPSRFPRVGDQFGRIPRPARSNHLRNFAPGHFPTDINHFANTVTLACPQIDPDFRACLQTLQSSQVSCSQVIHVNVIPNTGPIRRRPIIAENRNMRALPQGNLQDQGN